MRCKDQPQTLGGPYLLTPRCGVGRRIALAVRQRAHGVEGHRGLFFEFYVQSIGRGIFFIEMNPKPVRPEDGDEEATSRHGEAI